MSSSKTNAFNTNDRGNDHGPQSRQKGSTPNAGPISTPTNRLIQEGVTRSVPKPARKEPTRNFQEAIQYQERGGGNHRSQVVERTILQRTQSKRREDISSSETESDSDQDKGKEKTRSQRSSDGRRQVPGEGKYDSSARRDPLKIENNSSETNYNLWRKN